MDCSKTGELILKFRKQKSMTQKDVAEKLNISPKTVSKWERGTGCPDVSILNSLCDVLGVNIKDILKGEIDINESENGNMKKTEFYVCSECGNIISATNTADIYCCGKKLEKLQSVKADDSDHNFIVEYTDGEYYFTMNHPMEKGHYIKFVVYITSDKMQFIKLYPEQEIHLRFKKQGHGFFYIYCSNHGFFCKYI